MAWNGEAERAADAARVYFVAALGSSKLSDFDELDCCSTNLWQEFAPCVGSETASSFRGAECFLRAALRGEGEQALHNFPLRRFHNAARKVSAELRTDS